MREQNGEWNHNLFIIHTFQNNHCYCLWSIPHTSQQYLLSTLSWNHTRFCSERFPQLLPYYVLKQNMVFPNFRFSNIHLLWVKLQWHIHVYLHSQSADPEKLLFTGAPPTVPDFIMNSDMVNSYIIMWVIVRQDELTNRKAAIIKNVAPQFLTVWCLWLRHTHTHTQWVVLKNPINGLFHERFRCLGPISPDLLLTLYKR